MKTIVETNTGKVLFTAIDDYELQEGQASVDLLITEIFIEPYYSFQTLSFYEQATQDEVNNFKTAKALEIDLYYTDLITDVLGKHINKLLIDLIPIPQAVLDERDRLKAECNQKILALGIDNFSYRQQNIKLYKEL
jgi:hypothetical protein